jgi:hypothetical protein
MNGFTVEWTPAAEGSLAQSWLKASDPREVTVAQALADQLPSRDPVGNGRHLSEGLYRITVPPLIVTCTMDAARRVMEVNGVRSTS